MEELSQEEAKKLQQIWDKEQREEWKKEAQNKSFQCDICYDDKNINQECLTVCDENHRFCRECLKSHILSSYKENQGNVYCPNCPQQQDQRKNQDGSIIKLNYDQLEKLALGEKADLNVNITDCPNIWEKNGNKEDIKRIECQICGLKICLLCDKPEHNNSTCEQFAEYLKIKGKEDEKTLEYLRQNFRENIQCPSCRNIVTKSSGKDNNGELIKLEYNILEKLVLGQKASLDVKITECPMIWIKDEQIQLEQINCQICGLKICMKCFKPLHKNYTCEQIIQFANIKGKEEQMTIDYLRKNYKENIQCPKCKNIVTKNEGCINCGIKFPQQFVKDLLQNEINKEQQQRQQRQEQEKQENLRKKQQQEKEIEATQIKINQYILNQKEQFKQEALNKTFRCFICQKDKNVNQDCIIVCDDKDKQCRDCLKKHIIENYEKSENAIVYCNCPNEEKNEIDMPILKEVLSQEEYQEIDEIRLWYEIKDIQQNQKCIGYLYKERENGQYKKLEYQLLKQIILKKSPFDQNLIKKCPKIWYDTNDQQKLECDKCGIKICNRCKKPEHIGTMCTGNINIQQRNQMQLLNKKII
ncbi:hypothetical protein PPERSA_01957 [Pseudocohnilembus persalinus]|uniref:RBR-type E3 ubiquitin transferase n=1 Tax=Pseudocohnilembus persalinus TaxID=266149 RepID=A0A0V0R3N6_PSEPJ|nr:hypothetical protein PPERSA_01957 [Pseudocohnilembus persalinus]|eukprot:KRX09070.1 hypothetical protein PPERSA_01957 [Pseudocohnilembus persalinus]